MLAQFAQLTQLVWLAQWAQFDKSFQATDRNLTMGSNILMHSYVTVIGIITTRGI